MSDGALEVWQKIRQGGGAGAGGAPATPPPGAARPPGAPSRPPPPRPADPQRHPRPALRRRPADQHARLLSLVVEHDVERAVAVHVGQCDRLRVVDPANEAARLRGVLERAVALVAEVTVRAAQAAD